MKIAGAAVVLLVTSPIIACTCSAGSRAPACELIARSPVVFLGTVVAAERDPAMPNVSNRRIYRMRIDKSFKGLQPGDSTILVNPDNFTSCRASYRNGRQYLMFAERLDGQRNTLIASICSGWRLASLSKSDIIWLEKHLLRQTRTELFGKVLQEVPSFSRPTEDESVPVNGAIITARSGSRVLTQTAAPDGSFRFDSIQPGNWTITASKALFTPSRSFLEAEVYANTCAERFVELKPGTRLDGVILDDRGLPAANLTVELDRRSLTGRWSSGSCLRTQTDAQGKFVFENIPTGDYLLGYEIWGELAYHSAIPSTWYPGVAVRDKAQVLHFDADSQVTGATLRLLRPNAPRRIHVRVIWPNGRAPGSNLLQIMANDQLVQNLGGIAFAGRKPAPNDGTLTFTAYEGREHVISARYWVDDVGGPVPHDLQRVADSKPVRIPAGKGPVWILLILQPPVLADTVE